MNLIKTLTLAILLVHPLLSASTLVVDTDWTSDYLLNPYNEGKYRILDEEVSMVQLKVKADNLVTLSLDPNIYGIDEDGEAVSGGAVGGSFYTYRAELDSDSEDRATYNLVPDEDREQNRNTIKVRLVHLKKAQILRLVFINPGKSAEDYQTPVIVTLYQY